MIEVQVIGEESLLGDEGVFIFIDGTEDEIELVHLIEDELDNSLDEDVVEVLQLEPVDKSIRAYTGVSNDLQDSEFMEKAVVCVEYEHVHDFDDFIDLCIEMGFYHIYDVDQHYIGRYESNKDFLENFFDYEIAGSDSFLVDYLDWDALLDAISHEVVQSGCHYMRCH